MKTINPDNFRPDLNDGRHVLVFGSNTAGIHGKGAAKIAQDHWGARNGIAVGRTGNSYAIPTRKVVSRNPIRFEQPMLHEIEAFVQNFKSYAEVHPHLTFLVTKIGCGYAGYSESTIAPMFRDAPPNCILPSGWR